MAVCQKVESPVWSEGGQGWVHRLQEAPRALPFPDRGEGRRILASFALDGWEERAEYIYTGPEGTPRFIVVRYERGSGKTREKTFRQYGYAGVGPDETPRWYGDIRGVDLVPFRLTDLVSYREDPILIVEGEKDVLTLLDQGFLATCNPMGAGKWRDEYDEWFQGREVYIIVDNDEPGYKHGIDVEKHLARVAALVAKIPLCIEMDPHSDVSDWLAAGHTGDELIGKLDAAAVLARRRAARRPQLEQITAADLEGLDIPPLEWVVPEILPAGLTLFGGKAKAGKSWMILGMCMAITNGAAVFGDRAAVQGKVLYLALEDTLQRLQTRQRILRSPEWQPTQDLLYRTTLPKLSEGGLDFIREWLLANDGTAKAVFIDTYARILEEPKRGSTMYQADYASLQGLKELSDTFGIAICIAHHLRKMTSDDPLDLFSGTTGLTGGVDHLLALVKPRYEAEAVLHVNGRDGGNKELAMNWDTARARWTIIGDNNVVARSKEQAAVIGALRDAGLPLSPAEIAERLGEDDAAGKNRVRVRLHEMVKAEILYKINGKYWVAGERHA